MGILDLSVLESPRTAFGPGVPQEYTGKSSAILRPEQPADGPGLIIEDAQSRQRIRSIKGQPDVTLFQGAVDSLLRGLALQRGRIPGPSLSNTVREHLYRNDTSRAGLDLAALNVQRGRDHVIPGYGFWLRRCLGRQVRGFGDLHALIEPHRAQLLAALYV